MGRPDFGRQTAPPIAHALHDDVTNVANGDIVEAAAEPEPALQFKCRWRVPLTMVHNPSGVLLLYRDQLNAQCNVQKIASSFYYFSL